MNEIKLDSRNARRHGEKNQQSILKSLKECGTGRSIVLDSDGVIVAGNGVYEQAQALGLKVKIIESDGSELVAIKRTDLKTDDAKRKLLALADNRTAELAEWDNEALEQIISELPEIDLDGIGAGLDFQSSVFSDTINLEETKENKPQNIKIKTCPRCGFEFGETE